MIANCEVVKTRVAAAEHISQVIYLLLCYCDISYLLVVLVCCLKSMKHIH